MAMAVCPDGKEKSPSPGLQSKKATNSSPVGERLMGLGLPIISFVTLTKSAECNKTCTHMDAAMRVNRFVRHLMLLFANTKSATTKIAVNGLRPQACTKSPMAVRWLERLFSAVSKS